MATSFLALGRVGCATGQTVKKYNGQRHAKAQVQSGHPQKQRLKTMIKLIFTTNREVVVLMDDETQLTLDGNE